MKSESRLTAQLVSQLEKILDKKTTKSLKPMKSMIKIKSMRPRSITATHTTSPDFRSAHS